jgi:hypothetical protein
MLDNACGFSAIDTLSMAKLLDNKISSTKWKLQILVDNDENNNFWIFLLSFL